MYCEKGYIEEMDIQYSEMNEITIDGRKIGSVHPPFVIAEIGINHEGSIDKAMKMIDDASIAGCECVKFQSHIVEEEMVPNDIVPKNAEESIWDIINRCSLKSEEEETLKEYTESKGIIFLSTPFSCAAAERLKKLDVDAYKIGSGECNNYPLVEHIASFKKPIILSTGMNNLGSIARSVAILRKHSVPYALLHCTSIYPTPYDKVRLGALKELQEAFPDAVLGLSDHSLSNYPCLGAVSLGASILERHFTSDKSWPGPDIPISMDPKELQELISGSNAIYQALGGSKEILEEEKPTIDFAYASVVTIRSVKKGEPFTKENIWVKRPGNGEILVNKFEEVLCKTAKVDIVKDVQLTYSMING